MKVCASTILVACLAGSAVATPLRQANDVNEINEINEAGQVNQAQKNSQTQRTSQAQRTNQNGQTTQANRIQANRIQQRDVAAWETIVNYMNKMKTNAFERNAQTNTNTANKMAEMPRLQQRDTAVVDMNNKAANQKQWEQTAHRDTDQFTTTPGNNKMTEMMHDIQCAQWNTKMMDATQREQCSRMGTKFQQTTAGQQQQQQQQRDWTTNFDTNNKLATENNRIHQRDQATTQEANINDNMRFNTFNTEATRDTQRDRLANQRYTTTGQTTEPNRLIQRDTTTANTPNINNVQDVNNKIAQGIPTTQERTMSFYQSIADYMNRMLRETQTQTPATTTTNDKHTETAPLNPRDQAFAETLATHMTGMDKNVGFTAQMARDILREVEAKRQTTMATTQQPQKEQTQHVQRDISAWDTLAKEIIRMDRDQADQLAESMLKEMNKLN